VPVMNVYGTGYTEGNPGDPARSVSFDIDISPATPGTVSVSYHTVDGSAKAGSDYTYTSGTVTFSPGQVTKTVYVPVSQDLDYELDETFGLVLTDPVNTSFNITSATGTIYNDDSKPTVRVAGASVTE